MAEEFFKQLLLILSFSLVTAILLRRLKMTTSIAYMVVGVAIGPYALNFIPDPGNFSLIAEFGVVFLLFSLGLDFSLSKMLKLKYAVFGVGSIQVLVCTTVFFLAVNIWGATLETSIIIAGALALSSTAIVTKELTNCQYLNSQAGQLAVGILLFQDLIAVAFLILVPVLAGDSTQSLSSELTAAGFRGLLLICVLMALGKWVLPLIYKEVALGESDEVFVLSTLVIALLAGWLTHSFHLSMTLGSFVIGMMLGESPFKYQIESDISPFKDIFLGLFFVTIGMSLNAGLLIEYWPHILGLTLLLIFIKASVVALIVRAMRYQGRDAVKVGFALAQAGEFGLALIALAHTKGLVQTELGSFIILMIIFSMAVSPLLIRYAGSFSLLLLGTGLYRRKRDAAIPLHLYQGDHVIIGGFGRVGSTIAKLMDINNIPYIAIENNIDCVTCHREQGRNVVYGDCNKVDILTHCHLGEARLAILTFNSLEQAKTTIAQIRQKHIELPIIVRCRDNENIQELVSLGASHVFPEMLESSLLIAAQALNFLEIDEQIIRLQINEHRSQLTGL